MTFRHLRLKSPSIPRERTRDELIDSIVHTRTREHRAMPGEDVDVDVDGDVDVFFMLLVKFMHVIDFG